MSNQERVLVLSLLTDVGVLVGVVVGESVLEGAFVGLDDGDLLGSLVSL